MPFMPMLSDLVAKLGRAATFGSTGRTPAALPPGALDQSRLHGIIDAAMDAIVTIDGQHNIIVFNPAAEQMFGYPSAAILGSPIARLLPQRFRAAHGRQVDDFGAPGAVARRMGSLGTIAACRADGSEFPAEASISHHRVGAHIHYTAIIRDVSERNRIVADLHASEERERLHAQALENILFAVPAAVCIAHDRTLLHTTENDLHRKWFGADMRAAGHPFRAVLERAANGIDARNVRLSDLNRDGTVRHLLGNAITIWDEMLVPCGAICAFVDVTELALSELNLLSAIAGSSAKSDYITQMTHELRTPLGTMLGYAQLLDMAKTPLLPEQLNAVRQILKAGRHLRELVNEVQQLSTVDALAGRSTPERVPLASLLADMQAMIDPLLLKKQITAQFSCAGDVDIMGNPQHCRQVMLNLLSNAIKYNRDHGAIHVTCEAAPAGTVRIVVRDTGIGLDAGQVAALFQPFNRLGQEAGSEVGTGIGLVVTKRLVEAMGGSIGVDSSAGIGTAFWVSLPGAG
ncbi:MAG: PAS domain-containing sensor histidine kinase [Pseudomonadota bacterium]|nr:PAS domain-containing sensor histidine kinase [Pseudomonadota bacterium]